MSRRRAPRGRAPGSASATIPCDALYLDIDYMDGYRVFTFDEERFPDPTALHRRRSASDGFRVVTIIDPGVKVDDGLPGLRRGPRARLLLPHVHRGAEYRNVVWPGMCAFPDFTNARTRAWWGAHHAALLDQGVAGDLVRHERAGAVRPARSRRCPSDVVHPGGGAPRLHAQVHNLYGSLMARATREGLLAARPRRAPVRDLTRRLRGPAAPRAALDGRQLVVVGAPVDEHAPAPEPRAVRAGLGRRRRRRLLRRLRRRAARALDGVRRASAVLPQPLGNGHRAPGAVGVRRALQSRLPRHARAADAAAAVPLQAVRGESSRPARRSCARCCSSTPTTRSPTRPTTSSCSATRPAGGADHAPGARAPARLPAGGDVGALVHRRADRRPRARARPRAARPPRALRARQRARSRCGRRWRTRARPRRTH